MNKLNYIDTLLEKYFEGETSLEEEKSLRHYFSGSDIADKHKIYTSIFQFFTEERAKADNELLPKQTKKISIRFWVGIAAACSLLIFGGTYFYSTYNNIPTRSIAYIDGKVVSDKKELSEQALISIKNVSVDNEAVSEQIDVLDLFTE